jgi:hypothetical protein
MIYSRLGGIMKKFLTIIGIVCLLGFMGVGNMCNPCKFITIAEAPADYCPGQQFDLAVAIEDASVNQISYTVMQGDQQLGTPLLTCVDGNCKASFCTKPGVVGDLQISVTASNGDKECGESITVPAKANCTGICNL